jgi:hypothetical protein
MTNTPVSETAASNPLQAALLSSLMGGQTSGVDLQSLIAAHAGDTGEAPDERLNIALQWLEQRRATAAQSVPEAAPPSAAELELERVEEMRLRRERHDAHRAEARQLQTVMNSLYAEVETLRARNDTLAVALGACYLCFGEDVTCAECNGHGRPGSLLPDISAFRKYVAPAENRVRATQTKAQSGTSPFTGKEYQPLVNQAMADSHEPVASH